MNISELINQAIEYILLHIGDNVTAAEVAEHCHVSRFYFTRIFKEQTGESTDIALPITVRHSKTILTGLRYNFGVNDLGSIIAG